MRENEREIGARAKERGTERGDRERERWQVERTREGGA